MSDEKKLPQAVLFLGPTGSGKTPLGAMLEENGWRGRNCLHFDFGENLRMIADGCVSPQGIGVEDVDFLRRVLTGGALLEDDRFPLARRVFEAFLMRRRCNTGCQGRQRPLIVLNGLPRHVGQAEAIARIVEIVAVVCLRCSEAVVMARICNNTGGDRSNRDDDDRTAVKRKMLVFHERTEPLLRYYRRQNVPIKTVDVDVATTPQDVFRQIR